MKHASKTLCHAFLAALVFLSINITSTKLASAQPYPAAPPRAAQPNCGTANGANFTSEPTSGLCSLGMPMNMSGSGPWQWECEAASWAPARCMAQLEVEGACGSSNNADLSTTPTNGLCRSGTATPVRGAGPWKWGCVGSNGGSEVACTANLMTSGMCGSANGVAIATEPTASLCSSGLASDVTGSGPWVWTCDGTNGGATASCAAPKEVVGTCGASNHQGFAMAPVSGFCSSGKLTNYTGSGPWTWNCAGSNGGSSATCEAYLTVPGVCGTSNGADMKSAPASSTLCTTGKASAVSGTGPWNWTCAGRLGGATASCEALLSVDGSCGSVNGADLTAAPSQNLCTTGSASSVSGTGPWSWSCNGLNGGANVSCSALDKVSGICGPSNAKTFQAEPTTGLCTSGTVVGPTGNGPWAWKCVGSNGGTTSICRASSEVIGTCGSSNGTDMTSAPSTGLCATGTASSVAGSGPWKWTCGGSGGGATASCIALPVINGDCGSANGAPASSTPSTGLCSTGTASAVSMMATSYNWTCGGSNGGTSMSCAAPLEIEGACGTANGTSASASPSANLCASGTPSTLTGTGPWTWTCVGTPGTSPASCSASTLGTCGSAASSFADSSNLQIVATAAKAAATAATQAKAAYTASPTAANAQSLAQANVLANAYSPYFYTSTPSSANVEEAYLHYALTMPKTNLCATGTASAVSGGNGTPWTWSCVGTASSTAQGGANACSAMALASTSYPADAEAQTRTYSIHVPPGYNGTAVPLMFVFHGTDGTAEGMEANITGFDAVADANNFIVVYADAPAFALNSKTLTPNLNTQWTLWGTTAAPYTDVDYISNTLLPQIEATYKIDPKRVYASGYSDGSSMAKALACQSDGPFRGIGAVASSNEDAATVKECQAALKPGTSTPPISMVIFHGTADPIIPYNGGTTCGVSLHTVYSTPQTTNYWAGADLCNMSSSTTQDVPDAYRWTQQLGTGSNATYELQTPVAVTDTLQTYAKCGTDLNGNPTTVAFYTTTDAGHTWPGGGQLGTALVANSGTCAANGLSYLGPVSANLNASALIFQILNASP